MTKNPVSETARMVVTRVFDAPRELVWKAWTDPQYVMQWWGPKGFTAPVCKIDFRVGGKFLWCMKSPDGQVGWNGGEYHEIVPHEKIVYSMYLSDSEGNKIDPAGLGIEQEAIDGAYDVTLFEDLGNGRTKLTIIGNEPMASAKDSGQWEGWNETLEKVAADLGFSLKPEAQARSGTAIKAVRPITYMLPTSAGRMPACSARLEG